ncbi:16S rRNA (cytidine(1402)-2'-O)-methyltransferase, partial [Terrisporobacter hibernicus]
PGATAFVVALVGSGMNTHKFAFEGFLDRDKKIRRSRLEEVKEEERTMIFYESPHRLKDTLKDMLKILGNREISVNRELTKKYQEVIRQDIETVINIFSEKDVKGEFVLIVDGFKGEKTLANDYSNLSEREYVESLLEDGMSKKDAIKVVSKERKLKKDVVYKQVLDL